MPRANRYYLPGYVWHITHRCHKREFLLKFARDRRRWVQWLWEAKKLFGVSILNYAEAPAAVDGESCSWERGICKRDERETWGQGPVAGSSREKGTYELRESLVSYEADFGPKNIDLRPENTFFWGIST